MISPKTISVTMIYNKRRLTEQKRIWVTYISDKIYEKMKLKICQNFRTASLNSKFTCFL